MRVGGRYGRLGDVYIVAASFTAGEHAARADRGRG